MLDCKSPEDKKIAAGAPSILDYLCDDCNAHFQEVKARLDAAGIPYLVEPTIVRGLDYYTRTVFELVHTAPTGERVVCGGGGRYGDLIQELGGPPTEGIGFAMGLERLLSTMIAEGCAFPEEPGCDLCLVSMGQAAGVRAFPAGGASCAARGPRPVRLMGRSVKAQMKYVPTDQRKSTHYIVLGMNENCQGRSPIKYHAGRRPSRWR